MFEADGVTPLPIEKSPLYRALQGEAVAELEVGRGLPPATTIRPDSRARAAPGTVAGNTSGVTATSRLHDAYSAASQ